MARQLTPEEKIALIKVNLQETIDLLIEGNGESEREILNRKIERSDAIAVILRVKAEILKEEADLLEKEAMAKRRAKFRVVE